MTYAPINPAAYTAAFSGAIAGMAVTGWLTQTGATDYDGVTGIAGVFAEAFDIAWNDATALDSLETACITCIVQADFFQRGPGPYSEPRFMTRENWERAALACAALVLESDVYFAGQGIPPAPVGNVTGPAVSVPGAIAVYADASGETLADSGLTIALLLSGRPDLFASGIDGNLIAAAGTTTLPRDTYYNTVALTGTAKIITGGFKLYIQHWDASAAPAGAIEYSGNPGGDAIIGSSAGNAGGPALASNTVGGSAVGANGGDPVATGNGQAGGAGGNVVAGTGVGGNGGAGGVGGIGGNGAGGLAGTAGSVLGTRPTIYDARQEIAIMLASGVFTRIVGGAPGGGGGSGGGSGTGQSGGPAGGSGSAGGVVFLRVKKLTTSVATPAGVCASIGGRGGNGARSDLTGNVGVGAGGGAGGGGFIHAVIGERVGPAVPDFFDASGGNGGNGANGNGTGGNGNVGNGGQGGEVVLINMSLATAVVSVRNNAAGQVGGAARLAV